MGVVLDDNARGRAKPGDVVLVDGASAGELTSVAPLSVPGWSKQATALAMVKVKGELGDLPVMLKVSDGTVVAVGLVARHASQQPHD